RPDAITMPLPNHVWLALLEMRASRVEYVGRRWMRRWTATLIMGLGATFSIAAPALADPGFVVGIDQSALLSTVATPRVVIVGNPSIADVSLQGSRLVITGRSYGSTNLILLDQNGSTISEMPLTVVSDAP